MKPKHTPGPWMVIERHPMRDPAPISPNFARFWVGYQPSEWRGPSTIAQVSARNDGTVIQNVNGHKDEEIPGNAYLIAAAPEMYEALVLMEMHLLSDLSGGMRVMQAVEKGAYEAMLNVVQSAMAKARGET